jgi:hypothetical protein
MSILPTSFEIVQGYVGKCPAELASAFTFVLAVVCGSKPPDGIHDSEVELERYAWMQARIPPSTRSISENVVWLWVYSLMVVSTTPDLTRLRGSEKQLSSRTVLKMAIDLGQYLLAETKQHGVEDSHDLLDSTRNVVRRTWSCIKVFAHLHAIGTGTEASPSSSDKEYLRVPECRTFMSEPSAFHAGKCPLNPQQFVADLVSQIVS